MRFGAVFDSAQLLTSSLAAPSRRSSGCRENGHPYQRVGHDDTINNDYVFYGTNFKDVSWLPAWTGIRVTAPCSPTAARWLSISTRPRPPGADVEYYVANASS